MRVNISAVANMCLEDEKNSLLISIVTATYNARKELPALAASIASQTYAKYEWIIIDGLSDDGTAEYLQTLTDCRIKIIREKDSGIYDAMNKGVSVSSGDYIYFIGADDRLADDGVLASLLPSLKPKTADIVTGRVDVARRSLFSSSISPKILIINSVHHQGAFYRSVLFDDFRYSLNVPVVADYELNLIIFLRRQSWVDVDRIVAICGQNGVSNTTSEMRLYRSLHHIRRKYVGSLFSILFYLIGITNILRRRVIKR